MECYFTNSEDNIGLLKRRIEGLKGDIKLSHRKITELEEQIKFYKNTKWTLAIHWKRIQHFCPYAQSEGVRPCAMNCSECHIDGCTNIQVRLIPEGVDFYDSSIDTILENIHLPEDAPVCDIESNIKLLIEKFKKEYKFDSVTVRGGACW